MREEKRASTNPSITKRKLREKLRKLEPWRIDFSSIDLPPGTSNQAGGFGAVSRAVWTPANHHAGDGSISKPVAVKEMKIKDEADVELVLGLALREAKFLLDLSHKNIVECKGFAEDLAEKRVWLVLEWAENGNLRDFVASGDWEIPERIALIHDVTLGVEYLHSQSTPIYHGDLKSVNIVINSQYRAVITDFGSARRIPRATTAKPARSNAQFRSSNGNATLSTSGGVGVKTQVLATGNTMTLTGDHFTLRWAAPELLSGDPSTLACDIWSLGWVAYEVMLGNVPFHDVMREAVVIIRVIEGKLPNVSDHARIKLIQALGSFMTQCWSIDPERRPTGEECKKIVSWMPMLSPEPTHSLDPKTSQLREAKLNLSTGRMYREQGNYPSATRCVTKAIEVFTEAGDVKGQADGLESLAQIQRLCEEYGKAVEHYSEVLRLPIERSDQKARASALCGLGEIHLGVDEYDEAVKYFSDALQLWSETDDSAGRATAMSSLAKVHYFRGELDEALKLHSEVFQIRSILGDRRGKGEALSGMAEIYRIRREWDQAAKYYSEGLQIQIDVGDRRGRAWTLSRLADVYRLCNEFDKAIEAYSDVFEIWADLGNKEGRADALWSLGEVYRARNQYDEAMECFSECLQIYTDMGNKRGRAAALYGTGCTWEGREIPAQALPFYSEAYEIYSQIGYSGEMLSQLRWQMEDTRGRLASSSLEIQST